MECRVDVKNVPAYAKEKGSKYIVATVAGGLLWFWGCADNYESALRLLGDSTERVILKNPDYKEED